MELPRHYTVISSDIRGSSDGGYPRQADLVRAAEDAFTSAEKHCPYSGTWIRRDRGDGELTLAPADVPGAWVLAEFIRRLHIAVLKYNRNKRDDSKLRLRIGIDAGNVQVDPGNVPRGGDPINHAARLRDTVAAREAMAAIPSAPLVVMVSDRFYQETVPHGPLGLEPRMFRRVHTKVPGKNFETVAWLYVPGHQPPQVSGADQPSSSEGGNGAATTEAINVPPPAGDGTAKAAPVYDQRYQNATINSQANFNGDHTTFNIEGGFNFGAKV